MRKQKNLPKQVPYYAIRFDFEHDVIVRLTIFILSVVMFFFLFIIQFVLNDVLPFFSLYNSMVCYHWFQYIIIIPPLYGIFITISPAV